MKIYLLRHGMTECNARKQYQGLLDTPLSPKGRAQLRKADIQPEVVYTSPLCRTRETARILFPESRQVAVEDLQEMSFGVFEGRSFLDMAEDAQYRAWVDSNCEDRCPGGEKKSEFCDRSCAAFEALLEQALHTQQEILAIVAHGGTQMAVMERYGVPHQDYYQWCAPPGGGYLLETDETAWYGARTLTLLERIQYTQQEGGAEK